MKNKAHHRPPEKAILPSPKPILAYDTCRQCRYYDLDNETTHNIDTGDPLQSEDDYEAECRRFPPVRGDAEYFGSLDQLVRLSHGFSGPWVQSIYWCGEWTARQPSVTPPPDNVP